MGIALAIGHIIYCINCLNSIEILPNSPLILLKLVVSNGKLSAASKA